MPLAILTDTSRIRSSIEFTDVMACSAVCIKEIPFNALSIAMSNDLIWAVIRRDTARPAASSDPEFTRLPEDRRAKLVSRSWLERKA